MVASQNISSNCSQCPAPAIANCKTQSGEKCLACEEGYTVTALQDVCLNDSCAADGKESMSNGDCVDPVEGCEPG